jgi:hypothetical protein
MQMHIMICIFSRFQFSISDITSEESHLMDRIADLQLRLSHLDALYRAREYEAQLLHVPHGGGGVVRNNTQRSLVQDLIVSKKVTEGKKVETHY